MDERDLPSATLEHAEFTEPRTTRAAEGLPRRHFTVADVQAMVEAGLMLEDERVELIGGELVPMSAKGMRHEVVKAALLECWYKLTTASCTLIPETTFRLSEDTYLEPDIVVFNRPAGLSNLYGESVHLVVEIADSSFRYDVGRKALLYASFGVRELWVIDAVRVSTRVFRLPAKGGYAEALDIDAGGIATPLFAPTEFGLRLADLGIS